MAQNINLRTAHNYLMKATGGNYPAESLGHFTDLLEYAKTTPEPKKFKVALLFISLNPNYWQYAPEAISGAQKFFLPGHDVDMFMWSDMPQAPQGITIFPAEGQPWPIPTLYRYNLFLQQEEKIKDYDYIFYCDIDMKFVNVVGDEILGDGITAAQHPMYALKKQLWPPYEPNPESAAYIKRPGVVINDNDKPRFMPLYFAGGFQGGKAETFISAMKEMTKMIDKDLSKNYIGIWNDESYFNKYLSENPPSVVLTPSYIYPDSLINEYYLKIWGTSYPPKIITLTKKDSLKSLTPEEQQQLRAMSEM